MGDVEIVGRFERRRKWSPEEKAALMAEIEAEGGRVTVVARRHRMSESLLIDELLQRTLTDIFGLNVVYTEVRKIFKPWIFAGRRNPCLVDKHKLWANCRCFAAERAGFSLVHHRDHLTVPSPQQVNATGQSGPNTRPSPDAYV